MGLLQDTLCLTGVRHDWSGTHGGMRRCANCGTVEDVDEST